MNNNKKRVVIFENQRVPLNRVFESAEDGKPLKDYIFEGVCAYFGGQNSAERYKNNNNRFYDRDEYLALVDAMQSEIQQKMVAGSLDHPEDDDDEEKDIFTPKMKDLSHLVVALWYKPETDEVWIRIKLLDTHWGKDAMACADAGMPIFISSRASGYIEDDGHVILDKIHTYDIVYRPGFGQARLHPVLESYERNSSSVAIFECSSSNLNKSNSNRMAKRDKDDIVTEERLMQVCEKMQRDINHYRKVNEEEVNGRTVVSRVVAGKNTGSQDEFVWVKAEKDGRFDLLTSDGTVVLSDVSSEVKSAATSLIQNYSRTVVDNEGVEQDAGELTQVLKDNFEGNPFFESIDGQEITAEILDKNKDHMAEERYLQMLIDYLQNSTDDLETRYNYMRDFLKEVTADDGIPEFSEVKDTADSMIADFIHENKDLVLETRAKAIVEHQKRLSKNFDYIKESLTKKKIMECDEASAIVADFVADDSKPMAQKVELIKTLNDLYDDCNFEICDDDACTISDFLQEVSTNPEILNLVEKLLQERKERIDGHNIVAKRLNSVYDYLNIVATEYNHLVDDLTNNNVALSNRITTLERNCAVLEARLNKMMEYSEMIAATVNELIDHSDVIAKRVNTVTDYADEIAKTVNNQGDNMQNQIAAVTESLKKQKKENKKVTESLGSRLDKAIDTVISQKRTVAINENANKNKVFENDGSLRIPLRYRHAWNNLSETKRNEIICLFEYRNPRTPEEVTAIWESLNLGSRRLITESHKPIVASSLGYDDNDIDKLLGV